ncbi:hypothetical protein PQX77_003896 [Marasmius sp. AFHP31]|nr:hypothetical protein PQX77_003896 [Marasmius sp. AFHP31]
MGSASSKAARKLPKRSEVPSWTASRPAVPPHSNVGTRNGRPLASETKDEAITQDSRDPHFLANLNRLGPVNVNQPPQLMRTASVEKSRQLLESRLRADQEASSSIPARNRVSAPTLSTLLDRRKSARSQDEVDALVQKYGIDPAKFGAVSRYVNSPSIQGGSTLRTVGKDGEENVSVLAVWVEPPYAA